MVLVRVKDKRYHNGYSINLFQENSITEEIVQFVKGNPKAYWVESGKTNEYYRSREEFLKTYGEEEK